MKRFPYGRSTLLSIGQFTTSVSWSVYNVYVPLFARANLIAAIGNKPIINTLVGLIMVLDNLAALLLQPYIGELSDRTWIPKIGRRLPFVIIGLPLAALSFGFIGTYNEIMYLFLIAIAGFNISMAFYKTPVMSLIPDFLPSKFRSQGSGVMNVAAGVANITGLFVSSYFYKYHSAKVAFWVISAIMILCLAILIIGVREKKGVKIEKRVEKVKFFKSLKNMVFETERNMVFILIAIFFANAGYYAAKTFLSSYVSVVLGMSNYAAGIMLGVFFVFVIVSAIPAGYLGRRIGPVNATLIGLSGFIIGFIPVTVTSVIVQPQMIPMGIEPISLMIMRQTNLMTEFLTLNYLILSWEAVLFALIIAAVGFCYILAAINGIVVIWDLAPPKKIGTFTGYYYVFTSLAAILSPFIAGMVFDFVGFLTGKSGLKSLFVYITTFFTIALLFIIRVKSRLNKELEENKERADEIKEERKELHKKTLLLESLLFGQILRFRAARKLRRLQRQEVKDLKNGMNNGEISSRKRRADLKEKRKKLRQSHKEEREKFRKQNDI